MATVTMTSPFGDLKECLSLVNSGTTDLAYNFGNILKISDEYTFSCWFKANKNTKIKVQIGNNISDYFTVTTAWNKIVYTAKADISKSKVVLFSVPTGVTLYAFEGMLERGNMPSDFKKNEEDLENTVTTLQTDFKVEQGKITSLIKETETIKSTYTTKDEFNNLQIGGRNLLVGTNQGTNKWSNSHNGGDYSLEEVTWCGVPAVKMICTTATTSWKMFTFNGLKENFNILKPNETYTLSYDSSDKVELQSLYTPSAIDSICKTKTGSVVQTNYGYHYTYLITLNDSLEWKGQVVYLTNPLKDGSSIIIANLKLELGNKATDWTPAPEDLETKVTTLTDKYNQTVQTVEGNKTTIASIKTTVDDNTKNIKSMDSRMTTVETTADGLKTSVSKVQKDVEAVQTLSEQTASKFSWIVKSGSSSSDFTLTDRTAQLVADNINLKGLVKFSGLNSDAQTKINNAQNTADTANGKIDNLNIGGRNLVVGTSNADVNSSWKENGWTGSFLKYESENRTYKLIANNGWYMRQYTALTDYIGKKVTVSFKAKNISEETTATENYALGFTNPANGGSEYFTSFLTEGKPKQDEWIDIQYTVTLNTKGSFGIGCMCTPEGKSLKTTWLIKDLKIEKGNKATDWTPAPEDKANQSVIDNWAKDSIVAGETSINGGYIKTNTIETDQLAVDKIFATGSAVMNIINAQEINANRITSGLLSANRLDVYGLNVLNKETNQQTFSVSNNGEVSMRGSVSSYDYHEGKTGWTINKDGTAEFNDIIARGSVITNDGGIVSSGGTGENLQKNSSFYDGLNNWTYGSSFSADSSTQYNGTNSAKFSRTGLTADAPNYLYSGKTNIACKAGQTFTAQANFYTEDVSSVDSKGANFGIWFYTSDGAGCGDSYNIKKSLELTKDSWTHMEVTATAPDNAAYVALVVGVYRNGAFWVSQPKLEEGDIATPWSLSPDDKIKQVRFWAGATYDERESAPFIVYNDGTIKATQGEFSGVFSGTVDIGNITIQDPSSTAGGDAIVTIRNGQTGVNTVQLTDLKESKFAQNLVVTNNTYSNMIELRQDGTGLFSDGISVADTVVLNSSGVNINKALISVNPETKVFTMSNDLNVGTSNLGADLIVHGDASAENIRVSNVLYFGSVVKFTTATNGINIDYIGG